MMKKSSYPTINDTQFGEVTIDDEVYSFDVIIRADGKIEKRNKKIAQELFGTSHSLGEQELEDVIKGKPRVLIVGAGQDGCLDLTKEGKSFLEKAHVDYQIAPTPEAIKLYNTTDERKACLIHVTC